ncbi:MAG: hypothetical protein JXN61_18385, partial [Sedimentisphaerales bacterium]|nr:hypothetical protein [Sedimentisphaerales bacterium]
MANVMKVLQGTKKTNPPAADISLSVLVPSWRKTEDRRQNRESCVLSLESCVLLCLVAGVSVLCSGCAGFGGPRKSEKVKPARVTAAAGRNVVRSIEFRGNHAYKDTALRKKIGFEPGDYLDQVLAETGGGIISDLYRKKGYP